MKISTWIPSVASYRPFRLQATAGRKKHPEQLPKITGESALRKTFSFDALLKRFDTVFRPDGRLPVDLGRIRLDTLTFSLRQQRKQLNYLLRLANHPGNLDNVGMIALYGNIAGDRAILKCLQKSRSRRKASGSDYKAYSRTARLR